jgi:hypothetical protein
VESAAGKGQVTGRIFDSRLRDFRLAAVLARFSARNQHGENFFRFF